MPSIPAVAGRTRRQTARHRRAVVPIAQPSRRPDLRDGTLARMRRAEG